MLTMEWKIGEIKQVNGEWYQCIEGRCRDCYFSEERFLCKQFITKDFCTSGIIFKKLEKVGEPFIGKVHIQLQRYKIYAEPIVNPTENVGYIDEGNTIAIEIKENKEDMEENKLNLKPFDIQKARGGKSVCTRDGRSARIVCFDRVTNTTNEYTGHLIVLVTNPNGDEQSFYYTEKGNLAGEDEYDNHKYDLMMLPEKKEGWVNVYKDGDNNYRSTIYTNEKVALSRKGSDCITTIKIEWEE